MPLGEARQERLDEGKIRTARFGAKQVTATELASDPKLSLAKARQLDAVALSLGDDLSLDQALRALANSILPTNLANAQAVLEYRAAIDTLQKGFVESELERLYGSQNVTSRSSTVDASGVRTLVPGHGSVATPEQIAAVEANFQTPLQLVEARKSPNQLFRPTSNLQQRTPTIVSGAGVRRRPRGTPTPRPTILTSDSAGETLTRGKTLLG
jgi:hypothetical protein